LRTAGTKVKVVVVGVGRADAAIAPADPLYRVGAIAGDGGLSAEEVEAIRTRRFG
jgi:hypothetical protein